MPTDAELLHQYVECESEQAFTALVQRHLPVAYSAALRQVGGDPHRAQEVVQRVFTLLARKAKSLRHHPALIGWLYTTTHHVAAKMWRAEQRRLRLEEQAMNEPEPSTTVKWEQMRPVIDEFMLQLKERDRTAVLLRFFANQSYGEIGNQLGLTENTARMRVDRALESIRSALARRGIGSTSAALGTLLAAQAVSAAPEGLVATVSASVFSAGLGGGLFVFMSSTMIKVGVVVGVLAAGSAGVLIHYRSTAENAALRAELAATKTELAKQNATPRNHAGIEPTETSASSQPPGPNKSAVTANTRADLQDGPDPEKRLTHLQDLRNVGRATPAAAVQTILWAIAHGDATLSDMLFLNKPALASALEMMAALPDKTKEQYETPEKLAALYLSKYVLEQIDTVQIVDVRTSDFETVEVKIMTGEKGPTTVSMQATPNGWLWKVKASLIDRAKQDLLGSRAAPAAPR